MTTRNETTTASLRSTSFNRTKIADKNTREIISDALFKRFSYFQELNKELPIYLEEENETIKAARILGLNQLADEMTALT